MSFAVVDSASHTICRTLMVTDNVVDTAYHASAVMKQAMVQAHIEQALAQEQETQKIISASGLDPDHANSIALAIKTS